MIKKIIFSALILSAALTGCKKKDPPATTSTNTGTPAVNLKRHVVTVYLAYNTSTQTDPYCFLDLDSGYVYPVSTAAQYAQKIDLVYVLRYSNADDPMFISLGNFDGQPGYPISSWNKSTLGIGSFSFFNHTGMDIAPSGLTTAQFTAMTSVAQLETYLGNGEGSILDFVDINTSEVGDIYEFVTQQGKIGAFRVLDAQNGSAGYATLEVIVEP